MISLQDYRLYWTDMAGRAEGLTGVLPVTVDDGMARSVMALPRDSVTLFFLPPYSRSESGSPDAWSEGDECVVFVMARYDPQRRDCWDVLEQTQPVIERVKALLVADSAAGCRFMRVDVRSLSTMPETKFYAGFAGWSLGFRTMPR